MANKSMVEGLSTEQIITLAASRPEFVWQWGIRLNQQEANSFAAGNGLTLHWGDPIRPGDLYLARRNTGYKLLTCRELGEACVYPVEVGYPFDFNECVKVT